MPTPYLERAIKLSITRGSLVYWEMWVASENEKQNGGTHQAQFLNIEIFLFQLKCMLFLLCPSDVYDRRGWKGVARGLSLQGLLCDPNRSGNEAPLTHWPRLWRAKVHARS